MKNRTLPVSLALCMGLAITLSAHAQKLTLADAVSMGLQNNLSIQEQTLAVAAATEGVAAARSGYFPSVSANTGVNYRFRKNTSTLVLTDSGPSEVYTSPTLPLSASVTIDQPVFTSGQVRDSVRLAEETLRNAGLTLSESKLSLTVQIENAFYDHLLAVESADINDQTLQDQLSALDVAQKLNQSGLNAATDVLQAQANVESFRLTVLDSDNQVTITLQTLANLLGIKPEDAAKLEFEGTLEPTYVDLNADDLIQRAIGNSNSVAVVQSSIRSAEIQHALTKGSAGPKISASFTMSATSGVDPGTGANKYFGPDSWSGNLSGGLSIQLPVSSWLPWGERDATLKQEQDNLKGLKLKLQAAENDLQVSIRQVLANLEVARQKIKSGKLNVDLNSQLYEIATQQHSQGLLSSVDLGTSQMSYNNAQIAYRQSIYDYMSALINLQDTIGVQLLPAK